MKAKEKTGPALYWEAFWQGIRDLSGLSLGICLAVATMVAGVTFWLFNPATMAGPMGAYIPRSTADAEAFATIEALRLAKAPAEAPQALFFGSSSLAQMIGNAEHLEARLRDISADQWNLRILTTPRQSPFDQMRLIETAISSQTEDSSPIVLAIGIGLSRLGWTPERQRREDDVARIPLASTWAESEMRSLGMNIPSGAMFWTPEQKHFVILNGMKSLTRLVAQRPAKRVIDIYNEPGPDKAQAVVRVTSRIEDAFAQRATFYALQERLVQRIQQTPNIQVVFIEEALSPEVVQAGRFEDELALFRQEVAEMARSQGATFWPVIEQANLETGDYFDALHILKGDAQQICQLRIAEQLARLDPDTVRAR